MSGKSECRDYNNDYDDDVYSRVMYSGSSKYDWINRFLPFNSVYIVTEIQYERAWAREIMTYYSYNAHKKKRHKQENVY